MEKIEIAVYRRNCCRLCNGKRLEPVLQLVPTPVADAYIAKEALGQTQQVFPLDLFLCRDCAHLQLLDVVDPKALYGNYLYAYSSSLGLAEHFQKYADEILQRIKPPEGALVVDIGSNDGTFLKCFQKRKMRVLGIEPAPTLAQEGSMQGIETIPAFFDSELAKEIKRSHGLATVITTSHMFSNIDDVADMFEGIRRLLAPGGLFSSETFYLVDLMQNMVFDLIYHEHLSYYSATPLESFFRRHGLMLIDVEHVNAKGGSLRYTVQHLNGASTLSSSVARQIAYEAEFGANRSETFKDFAQKINNVKQQLLELLEILQAQGKTIAGYGASATTTTLLYHFGLGRKIDYIVDENPVKVDRFSPGYHIPVLSPKVLYSRHPDYVLIFAWRYAEAIIKKHREFLEQGGHFIVPLPELKVV